MDCARRMRAAARTPKLPGYAALVPAEPLGGGVYSPFADFAPALSPDGRLVYFTSERPGVVPGGPDGERPPGDIYRVLAHAVGLH